MKSNWRKTVRGKKSNLKLFLSLRFKFCFKSQGVRKESDRDKVWVDIVWLDVNNSIGWPKCEDATSSRRRGRKDEQVWKWGEEEIQVSSLLSSVRLTVLKIGSKRFTADNSRRCAGGNDRCPTCEPENWFCFFGISSARFLSC